MLDLIENSGFTSTLQTLAILRAEVEKLGEENWR